MPFLYKYAVDALENNETKEIAYLSAPFFFVLAYGAARIFSNGFAQLRDPFLHVLGNVHCVCLLLEL